MYATLPLLAAADFQPIRRWSLDAFQFKLGVAAHQSAWPSRVAASRLGVR